MNGRHPRVRVALRLGFFICGLSGCSGGSAGALARGADAVHGTRAFSWLATHRPAALVVWRVAVGEVAPLLPESSVIAASREPCAQAKAAHAALLVVERAGPERDRALGCGVALFRDEGAVVEAPL